MPAEHPAVEVHDVARLGRAGPELLDHRGIGAVRHEADVLAVGLVGDRQAVARRQRPGLGLGGEAAEREAQEAELLAGGREQEIALVARRIGGTVQLRPRRPVEPPDVVAGRHAVGLEVARGLEQVAELHPLVAADAGHRRRAGEVGVGELVDHARRGSGSRSRARSAGSPSPRPPAARRGCRARRSRRPSSPAPRHGRRAAASPRRRRSPPRPASPPPPSCRRRPTSPRRTRVPPAASAGQGC